MILDKKRRLVEDLLKHLDDSQGGELKDMIAMKSKPAIEVSKIEAKPLDIDGKSIDLGDKPDGDSDFDDKVNDAIGESGEDPDEEKLESPKMEASEHSGLDGEIPKESDDGEKLSDEELSELLKQYLS